MELIPETLKELHRIREQIAQEEAALSAGERVQRTRQEAETLLKAWGLALSEVQPLHRAERSSAR